MTTAADDGEPGDGDGDGDGTGGDDDDPTATSGDGDGDGDGSSSVDGDGDGGTDGGQPACEGDAPWCLSDGVGTCPHSPGTDAVCDGTDWVCPEGYNFEADLTCTPEGECEGPGCPIHCAELDSPPPGFEDCWDQGPGECADSTIPPTCAEDGSWVCPDGWGFGGFGESCTFPGG